MKAERIKTFSDPQSLNKCTSRHILMKLLKDMLLNKGEKHERWQLTQDPENQVERPKKVSGSQLCNQPRKQRVAEQED